MHTMQLAAASQMGKRAGLGLYALTTGKKGPYVGKIVQEAEEKFQSGLNAEDARWVMFLQMV